jgi:ParB family chromosome partitioning protein
VVAGGHRFAACDLLGLREIACIVVDDNDLHAELAMIDENLLRAELSPADQAIQTARRKAIYLKLHPETGQHIAGAIASNAAQGNATDNLAAASFASDTAKATSRGERTIRRDAERGEKIDPAVLEMMRGTSLDRGVHLDRLKRIPPHAQLETVTRELDAIRISGGQGVIAVRPAGSASPGGFDNSGLFKRFIGLVDRLEALPVAAVIADSGRDRAVLGQRASRLADR